MSHGHEGGGGGSHESGSFGWNEVLEWSHGLDEVVEASTLGDVVNMPKKTIDSMIQVTVAPPKVEISDSGGGGDHNAHSSGGGHGH